MKFKTKWLGAWIFSLWPIFLLVSQKALIPLKILEFFGRQKYQKGISLIIFGTILWIVLSLNLLLSFDNTFALKHYISFSFFIFFMVIFGLETLNTKRNWYNSKLLTRINFFVLIIVILLYHLRIDLSGFRGLNFISGSDNVIQRMFIETSSLLVISNFRTRSKSFNVLLVSLTLYYIIFLNKSLFLIALLFYQLILQYNISMKKTYVFILSAIAIILIIFFYSLIFYFRGDLILSTTFKLNQVLGILENIRDTNLLLGHGLGYYLPEFATDLSQPYQIESQLSMLFLQIGVLGMTFYLLFLYNFFRITNPKHKLKAFGIYLLIGLINPWLFLPTWLITSTYFFHNKKYD